MSTTELYLDPAPLLDAVRNGRPWHVEPNCPHCTRHATSDQALCITTTQVAATLDVATRTVQGWRAGTGRRVRGVNADRLAVACGLLDWEIWPELLEQAFNTCAQCNAAFVPNRPHQKYCQKACRLRAATIRGRAQARERYATDPEIRVRKQAAAKARRDAAKRADAITKRQWYRAHREDALTKRRARYQANREYEKARQAAYRVRTRQQDGGMPTTTEEAA